MPGYTLTDYGAVVTQFDSASVNAALVQVGSVTGNKRAGEVLCPAEKYTITSPILMPNFVRLYGPGRPWHTAELGAYGDPPNYYGADFVPTGNFHMFGNLDQVHGNTGIEIDRLRIDQRGVTGDFDIMRFNFLWRSSIHNNDFLGASSTTKQLAVNVLSGEENRIEDNRTDLCGIRYVGNAAHIHGNDIGAFCKIGIEVVNGSGNNASDNHIYNAHGPGMRLENQAGGQFEKNRIEDCDYDGIYGANWIQDCIIARNVCNQNSRIGAGQAWGIRLDSDTAGKPSTGNILAENQCIDRQTVKTQTVGISLASYSGAQTNNNLVTANRSFGGIAQKAGLTNTVTGNI